MIFRPALFLIISSALIGHIVDAQKNGEVNDPQPIPTSTDNPNTTSSEIPTTQKPTTTSKPSPTTSAKPTSTAAPTTPSTPDPTTSTKAPTTTAEPVTTSTKAPITTPAPTAAPTTPKPSTDWVVKNGTTICIIANMGIKVTVPYHATNNKTVHAEFNIEYNKGVTASGTCGALNQILELNWGNGTATFKFSREANKTSYSLHSIVVLIDVTSSTFPNNTMTNVTKISFVHDAEVFSVAMNHSYTCASVNPLNLNGTAWNNTAPTNVSVPATLTLSKVHAEAFGTGKEAKYSSALDCTSHETPDIVPIAVGLILAGLVIVVLIAYLVGRRRAQARGYLSM